MFEFLSKDFYSNTIKEWLIAFLVISTSVILGKVVYLLSTKVLRKLATNTKSKLDDVIIDRFEKPIIFAIIIIGIWIGISMLEINATLEQWIGKAYIILIAVNITWLLSRCVGALMDLYIEPLTEKTNADFDNQIYPVVKKSLIYTIWTVGIIVGLNNAGYDVGAVIASLGIGGIALAMAAKDTVSNVFGGFTIFTDKPFRVGDRIKISGYEGMVSELGLRSFRLRTLQGTIVTIPNSIVTGSCVENVSLEQTRKVTLNLGLTYSTSPEKITQAIEILNQIAIDNQSVLDDHLVSFNSFGDFNLGILFIYYIKKGENILTTQSEINIAILSKFNQNNLVFAFPTQSIYIEKTN